MAKVKQDFFCIQTKVSYKAGDEYTGTRTDLGHVLEIEEKEQKTVKQTKELKTKKSTK
tara:strand:+ start:271 stop:444 length:174 start_codon:yes stop_codon:yes gene_type:complete